MEFHSLCINNMCRICTQRAQTRREIISKKPPRYIIDHSDIAYILFGVDIAADDNCIHPTKICDKCYNNIKNSYNSGTQGQHCYEINLNGIYGRLKDQVKDTGDIWKQHCDSGCKVCTLYKKQSKPGFQIKQSNYSGKLKLRYDNSSTNIFDKLFSRDISIRQMPECELLLSDRHKEQFSCPICLEILPTKTVTTGCHNYCSSCISKTFQLNNVNSIACPVCQKSVLVEDIAAANAAFHNILNNQPVICNVCKYECCVGAIAEHVCKPKLAEKPSMPTTPYRQSLLRNITSPLNQTEEKMHTLLTKRKLHNAASDFIVCKTGGQPLCFMKVSKSRKKSSNANSPLKKSRARKIARYRQHCSGDSNSQLSAELKLLTKDKRLSICEAAGVNRRAMLRASQQLALKSALGLSWTKNRVLKRFCRSVGVQYESERKERNEIKKLIHTNMLTSQLMMLWKKDENAPDSVMGMVQRMSPAVFIPDLKTLVTNRLDVNEAAGCLTWEGFPSNEIHVKVGGDHGGGTFKMCLQIANVKKPNSRQNTIVIGCFQGKDNAENLKTMVSLFNKSFKELEQMEWKGKRVRLYAFGDYAFLCSAYGLSGASGTYPCLWCNVRKTHLCTPTNCNEEIEPRTLDDIIKQQKRFCVKAKRDKKKAGQYFNCIREPLLHVPLSEVCPPYLHILLGVVKQHNDLLEERCHTIDIEIANDMARKTKISQTNISKFHSYVQKRQRVMQIELNRAKLQKELEFEETCDELLRKEKKGLLQKLSSEISRVNSLLQSANQEACLDKLSGPVTANITLVLKKHGINVQAFHSRSFIGNHCARYLRPSVYRDIGTSIEVKTKELTEEQQIIAKARTVGYKFNKLNELYSNIHNQVSHARPIKKEQITSIETAITSYCQYFRNIIPSVFTPKQHILEKHVIPWIEKHGFGMGLYGEQGGEACHREFNILTRRLNNIPNPLSQLTAIMKEHIILTHPQINRHIVKPKKRKHDEE